MALQVRAHQSRSVCKVEPKHNKKLGRGFLKFPSSLVWSRLCSLHGVLASFPPVVAARLPHCWRQRVITSHGQFSVRDGVLSDGSQGSDALQAASGGVLPSYPGQDYLWQGQSSITTGHGFLDTNFESWYVTMSWNRHCRTKPAPLLYLFSTCHSCLSHPNS